MAAAVVTALVGVAAFAVSASANAESPSSPGAQGATTAAGSSSSTASASTPAAPVPASVANPAASGTSSTPTPATAPTTAHAAGTANGGTAAGYLIKQLVDGDHLEFSGGFGPNYGGSIDIALALAAQGKHDKVLTEIVNYVGAHVADYADPNGAAAKFPGPYTGAAAKAALLAEVTGKNPRAFGGFDLIKTLLGNVCKAATSDGNCTAAGDFSQVFSTVGQSLAVLALARDHATVPAAALARLEQLQCADGGFNSLLIAAGAKCSSDVDSTGFAIQALKLVPGTSSVVSKAVTFLDGAQNPDGGFTGAAGENSNSTALAIQGLLAASTTVPPAVAKALAWLASRQNSDGGFGISSANPASDEGATAQSLPAILSSTLATLTHSLGSKGGGSGSGSSTPSSGGTSSGTGPLAATGTDVTVMLVLAFALLAAGALAMAGASRRGRRVSPVVVRRDRA